MISWWNEFVSDKVNCIQNQDMAALVQEALQNKEGHLSSEGALVVKTGAFTGRAADDKYVVRDNYTESRIHWEGVKAMKSDAFEKLKNEFIKDFNSKPRSLYMMERSVGADENYSLGVRLITTHATHALFARHMFRDPLKNPEMGFFTIFHNPNIMLDPKTFGLRSSTVIAINFERGEILIGGTAYAGEVKKAIFSVMNVLLPDREVLPMHSGANIDENNKVTVFFGLSGTGKTTLSTDVGKYLIGDDEHGISPAGIFNIEGGCYAKTYNLTEKGEPQVYHAVNRFGAILENVVLDEERRPKFEDKSITENGRGSYPLTFISDASDIGLGPFPSNIFFLSADAMGVLPAIAKLDSEQAMYYFLSGYTAKLAGTEVGLAGIKAAFSHCFGAPFMMRHPQHYADLLKKYLDSNKVNVWLANTGWYAGPYGEGTRYDLSITRSIIRGIQKGLPANTRYIREEVFGLSIPESIPGVESKFLNARALWKDGRKYDEMAQNLKQLFSDNYKKINPEAAVQYQS